MSRVLPETLRLPLAQGPSRAGRKIDAAVVGGGIAGVAAATILSERGVRVSLFEREGYLGGRAGAWESSRASGETFEMERGFHAFFRHYYNLRSLLRRVDPTLAQLAPLADYPVLGPDGSRQSFAGLPTTPPMQFAALAWRSSYFGARDLLHVNVRAALEMLAFDMERSFARYDDVTAGAYLDSLGFPDVARRMLFDVFAHSFFNLETEMSAAEFLMMVHFYFSANREGLVFDVPRQPFSTAIWTPFERWLRDRGVAVATSSEVHRVERARGRWCIEHEHGVVDAELLVLALPVDALKRLVAGSRELGASSLGSTVSTLDVAPPFAVWRLWLDRAPLVERAPFAATSGLPMLDNISIYDRLEDDSRRWGRATGGSVIELHAYAVGPEVGVAEIKAALLADLHHVYPETRTATILDERFLLRRDCPSFAPGSHADRPVVATPFPDVAICGDFVRLPFPSALMERAASAGVLAANTVLASIGLRSEPLRTVARRGLLAMPTLGRGPDA